MHRMTHGESRTPHGTGQVYSLITYIPNKDGFYSFTHPSKVFTYAVKRFTASAYAYAEDGQHN